MITKKTAPSMGAIGGRRKTPAKMAALRAMQQSRKGRRVNNPPPRERETVLAEVWQAVREPVAGIRSIRVAAAWCGVDSRTVRRWLTGEDWPPATQLRRLQQWLRSIR